MQANIFSGAEKHNLMQFMLTIHAKIAYGML